MAPEYGATMGFFGVDDKTLDYFANTGRSAEQIETIRNYYTAQNMFGLPQEGDVDYSTVIDLSLETITPSVAGPKRPQDRIELSNLDDRFVELFSQPTADGGYGKNAEDLEKRYMVQMAGHPAEIVAGGGDQSSKSVPLPILSDSVSDRNTSVTTEVEMINNRPTPDRVAIDTSAPSGESTSVGNGDVLIAAITS